MENYFNWDIKWCKSNVTMYVLEWGRGGGGVRTEKRCSHLKSLLSFVLCSCYSTILKSSAIAPFWSPVGPLVIKVLNDNLASKFHITCRRPYTLLSKPGPFWQWNGATGDCASMSCRHWDRLRLTKIQPFSLWAVSALDPITFWHWDVNLSQKNCTRQKSNRWGTLLKTTAIRERDWPLLEYNRDGWGCVASEQEGSQWTEDCQGELLRYEGHGNPC